MPKKVLHKKRKRRARPRCVVETRIGSQMSVAGYDRFLGSAVTYQLERRQCGKRRCHRWHGPYWYAYWTAGGRTRSLYIGKALRPAAEVAAELVERRKSRAAAAALTTGETK